VKVTGISFVGVPVTNIERARQFYEGVLGLTRSEEMGGGQWIEYTVGNGIVAIGNVGDQWKPSEQGTCVAFELDHFDDAIAELRSRNVVFDAEPFETPCCHMAVVQDPDGNKVIIHKLKPEN